jgi:DNA-binding transcriptional LysR family regulator
MHNLGAFDWNDLRHFLAVAREGSTLAAAKVLNVNQSTVHRRLTALEECLGCTLAERHPSGYRLTELGRQLQRYAENVEDAVGAFQRHVASFDKGIRGTVRVTCSTGVAYLIMTSRMLDAFHARHPELKVELLMTETMFDLAKGEADVAIRGGQPKDEALIGRKMADVPWGIYASHAYVERHGRPGTPEDLDGHSRVEFIGEIADLKAARWMRAKAPNAAIAGQSSNLPSVLLAVKSGAGVAALPAPLANRDRDLVCVLGPVAELSYPMYLLTHRDLRRIPRINAFFDFCVSELRPVLTGSRSRKAPAVTSR